MSKVVNMARVRLSNARRPAWVLTKDGGRWNLEWEGAPGITIKRLTIVDMTQLAQCLTRELYESREDEEE